MLILPFMILAASLSSAADNPFGTSPGSTPATPAPAAGNPTTLHAQEFLPELAPYVAKYKSDTGALTEQKNASLESSKRTYLAALASAEAAATNAGHVPIVAAITRERESIDKGTVAAEFPKDFPKNLQSPKKAYLDSLGRVSADFTARQQRIDAEYLRVLASLQMKANANPALADQIASQKNGLLNNPGGGALVIVLATYQGAAGENPQNVTAHLKKIMESGAASTKCTPIEMKTDPIPFHAKILILDYTTGGAVKRKKFSEGDTLSFHELLK